MARLELAESTEHKLRVCKSQIQTLNFEADSIHSTVSALTYSVFLESLIVDWQTMFFPSLMGWLGD